MSSKICREVIENIVEMCRLHVPFETGNLFTFRFAIYVVGNRIDLNNIESNHKNFHIKIPVSDEFTVADDLIKELDKVVLGTGDEIAISNSITLTNRDFINHRFNLAFADYKSKDQIGVLAVLHRSSMFRNAVVMRTDASFHAYGPPLKDSVRDSVTKMVLNQKTALDVDWAMICLLRNECFLRVSHNVKGEIVRANSTVNVSTPNATYTENPREVSENISLVDRISFDRRVQSSY